MHPVSRTIAGACLILAPAIQAISTFYWSDRHQGITAGTLIVAASVGWIVGLVAIYRLIEPRVPRYAAVALPVAVYGCVGGATFGVQGMQEELFGVSHAQAVHLLQEHQAAAFVAFWFAGSAFPVSVLVLGAVLTWIRAVPVPIGILTSVSAVAFPLSRIPREIAIAHVADLALLIPFAYLGIRMAMGNYQPLRIAAPTPSPRGSSPDSAASRRR